MQLNSTNDVEANRRDAGLRIQLLEAFRITYRGQAVCSGLLKRTLPRRMIQLIGSSKSLSVPRARLLQALWPSLDKVTADNRLHQAIHWLRKSLKELPEEVRPALNVSTVSMTLSLPDSVQIDVQSLRALVLSNGLDHQQRYAQIRQYLNLMNGELAPDWIDGDEIAEHRVELSTLRLKLLEEACDLAESAGKPEEAAALALKMSEFDNAPTGCHYEAGRLLWTAGLTEKALSHCVSAREFLVREAPDELPAIDQLLLEIRKSANRLPNAGTGSLPDESVPLVSNNKRTPVVRAERWATGFDHLLEATTSLLANPFTTLIFITGQPGSGKSLLAANVAQVAGESFQNGALWVDGSGIEKPRQLELAIQDQIIATGLIETAQMPPLADALHNMNLLVIVDNLSISETLSKTLASMAVLGDDCRWIVTTNQHPCLPGERVIEIEPEALLQPSETGDGSPACRIAKSFAGRSWPVSTRALACIDDAARLVDGLPAALVVIGAELALRSATELVTAIRDEPAKFLRQSHAIDSIMPRVLSSVRIKLESIGRLERTICTRLLHFTCGLTRQDIELICADYEHSSVDDAIDSLCRSRLLRRKVQDRGLYQVSTYRLSFLCIATLRDSSLAEPHVPLAALDRWVFTAPFVAQNVDSRRDDSNQTLTLTAFDERFEDIHRIALLWATESDLTRLSRLCRTYRSLWLGSEFAPKLRALLSNTDLDGAGIVVTDKADILLSLAQLDIALNEAEAACLHARRVLQLSPDTLEQLQLDAASNILAKFSSAKSRADPVSTQKALQAASALMRVAHLSAQRGSYANAVKSSEDASRVFKRHGLYGCDVEAILFCSRVSFLDGNLTQASQCAQSLHELATLTGRREPELWANLVLAEVSLSCSEFGKATHLVNSVSAHADAIGNSTINMRALQILAWSQFGQGAFSLSQILCNSLLKDQACAHAPNVLADLKLLSALLAAKLDQKSALQMTVRGASDALERFANSLPPPSLYINVSDLAATVGRQDLAQDILAQLSQMNRVGQISLQPWERKRVTDIGVLLNLEDSPLTVLNRPREPATVGQLCTVLREFGSDNTDAKRLAH